MYKIWKSIFSNGEKERQHALDMLDMENNFLDQATKENAENSEPNLNLATTTDNSDQETAATSSSCCVRKGVITELTGNAGRINNSMSFSRQTAGELFRDLNIGCVVEYLVFQQDEGNFKVIKIHKILEHCWEKPDLKQVQEMLDSLKLEQPTNFNTQLRTILGVITQRLSASIEVNMGYCERIVELDKIAINFIPKKGDEISLECIVQLNDGYVDKQGEILLVKKVSPTRIETNQKCIIERVFEEIAVMDNNAYVLKEDVPTGISLHLGDTVRVDLIECKHSTFTRRAIRLILLEKNFGQVKNQMLTTCSTGKSRAISIEGEDRFVFVGEWKKHNISFKLKNTGRRTFELKRIEIPNKRDAQITLLEPVSERHIEMGTEISLIFEVYTKFIGEVKEHFILHFDNFKVSRFITIIVCETDEDAREAKRRLIASQQLMVSGKTVAQRSRQYAYQVSTNKYSLVKGESVSTKRRFIKTHFAGYDVPDRLLQIVLKTERVQDMLQLLTNQYPYLEELLSYENYAKRFDTLLFLEEIEYMINFRNFDRERAHFQRDGKYLSLHVENLAERRPSLVLGDSVNAINPWVENSVYQGIIHKVLFDRVLLKFNASFQQQYNSEDYRLEFHFSRYGFRKQHYAVNHITDYLGQHFLFPSKVTKRDNPQLDIQFRDDVMHLYDDQLPWFNPQLNSIQKRAIYNILRGESDRIPYVIFGPPGTGKTVTLVETVLQLVYNLPGARVLVGTPSNSSADLITKRIIDSNVLQPGEFVRLVSHNQVEKDLVPPELMNYCATIEIGILDDSHDSIIVTDSGLKLRCPANFLGKHRVTISTCSTLGNFIQMDFPSGHFTHLLIDEAGQCTEPETMVPIALVAQKRSQVILAGDPMQLQAIVSSRHAVEFGLPLSFLERLLQTAPYRRDLQRFPDSSGYNPDVLTKLLYNYRAIPSIMSVYSRLFYDNELIAQISKEDSHEAQLLARLQSPLFNTENTPRTHGAFFHGILGENRQDMDSPSWYNVVEAVEVFKMCCKLYGQNVSPQNIGIMSPYSKQVKVLRTLFIGADMDMPKIGSVEEFQGQERDIMLISTVRSSQDNLQSDARLSLGFVHSSKRMNVAVSRARCLMVIFGNPQLLALDDCWRHLILYCANNNAYIGCELPSNIQSLDEELDKSDVNLADSSD
ncbi:probable RNA helicase armi [Drosophila grimshawi]|uniref:RNA helicase n=1 Tax=Drosophila grimshawi TaxID=7222 RepID=B4J3H9_DROGR|nr:probable RNA helicase armi [Drosophila grimshawi]EDV96181.1 GH16116 [Drosophila grimshawi]